MVPFSTEFPVTPHDNRAAFVAEVVAWIGGMQHQKVLSNVSQAELDGANVHIRSPSGEELRMRELLSDNGWAAIGIRHDLPDDQGRLWRTECVLKRGAAESAQDVVRLRTHCVATRPGVQLDTPKKPYLIKALLKNNWGGQDHRLSVSDEPVWIEDNEAGLTFAKAVTLGEAAKWLPIVYVSASRNSSCVLSERDIEKLAFDLGGIAHVVVEPNRAFSFPLRDETQGRNAYGGAIGLSVPGQGVVRRYYLGWQIDDGKALAKAVIAAATSLRSQMPAIGWDWTELQEQALRKQREREKESLTEAEWNQLHKQEIDNLREKIRELEQQLEQIRSERIISDDSEFSSKNFISRIGPEIYSGEISDRLRFAASATLSFSEQIGLDKRSKAVLQRVVERLPPSPACFELSQDITRATKDPKRVATQLTSLLTRHGYYKKSDNKHIRLEAESSYVGLDAITLPKTPSENRGLTNLRKQIEQTLGLTKLKN